MTTFKLIEPSSGLYISEKQCKREPTFTPAYFAKAGDGWYKDLANDIHYKYDALLNRIFALKFGRNLPPYISDQELIQFSNKTIY